MTTTNSNVESITSNTTEIIKPVIADSTTKPEAEAETKTVVKEDNSAVQPQEEVKEEDKPKKEKKPRTAKQIEANKKLVENNKKRAAERKLKKEKEEALRKQAQEAGIEFPVQEKPKKSYKSKKERNLLAESEAAETDEIKALKAQIAHLQSYILPNKEQQPAYIPPQLQQNYIQPDYSAAPPLIRQSGYEKPHIEQAQFIQPNKKISMTSSRLQPKRVSIM